MGAPVGQAVRTAVHWTRDDGHLDDAVVRAAEVGRKHTLCAMIVLTTDSADL